MNRLIPAKTPSRQTRFPQLPVRIHRINHGDSMYRMTKNMRPSSPIPNQSKPPATSNPACSAVAPCIANLNELILINRAEVSETLLSHKRTRLARLVACLPDKAATVHALCLNDLPIAAEALGLSSLSLACSHARNGELVQAVQAADRGIVMLGPVEDVLHFIEGVENSRARGGAMNGEGESPEEALSEKLLGTEEEVQISVPQHLSGVCAEVSAYDFSIDSFRDFFKRDEPVVIRSCAPWRASDSWREVSYWQRYSHRMVPVELEEKDGMMREAFLPLREVMNAMLTGRRVYMAQHTLLSQIPSLCEDIEVPVYTQVGGGADVINVWMGSSATGSKLHHDSADNILVQVVGHKTVVLLAPDEPVYATGSNFSHVDVENPDYDTFPMFAEAAGKKVGLSPGDGLYIPAGYWHYVRSRTSSISVNFWF